MLVPFKHISFRTSLTPEMAAELISSSISPGRYTVWQSPVPNRKRFQGEVSREGFRISIPQDVRNSFMTFMYGRFSRSHAGVRVDAYLTWHPLIIAPIVLFWIVLSVAIIINLIKTGSLIANDAYKPLAILIGSYLLVCFMYFLEAKQLEGFLLDLFQTYRI